MADQYTKIMQSRERMLGMKLPGGAKVQPVEVDVPEPGPGQVLLKMKAASLCGSDLKYIYFEHTDKAGGARYDNVIAGHEPSGQIVEVGEDVRDFPRGRPGCGLSYPGLRVLR
jgi:threonine dehydrogenase-like Zn-dependent dehydrogenase